MYLLYIYICTAEVKDLHNASVVVPLRSSIYKNIMFFMLFRIT